MLLVKMHLNIYGSVETKGINLLKNKRPDYKK